MLALLNAQKYEAAAEQFHRWVRGGNGVLPGPGDQAGLRACAVPRRADRRQRRAHHPHRCKAPSVAPDFGTLIDIYAGEKRPQAPRQR
jgi:hypothetical protein